MNDMICILDIGSWNIKAVVVRLFNGVQVQKVYFSTAKSMGLDRGKVTNLDYLSDSVEQVVSNIEMQMKIRISKVNVCISGDHIKGYDSKGIITISEFGSEIKQVDVKKAMDSAKLLSVPMDRRILHIYEQGFVVDGQTDVTMPVGMFGKKLEANLHIITALENKVQSIIKAVNNVGIQVDKVLFSGFMNVYGVLSEKQRIEGAVILDIGAGSSSITGIKENNFFKTKIFDFSSIKLTEKIKQELKIPFKEAELKKKELVSFYPKSKLEKSISLNRNDRDMIEIVYNFLSKELKQLKNELDNKLLNLASENFIVTGETALMGGLIELIEDIFKVKAKTANPKIVDFDKDLFLNLCQYSACVGGINLSLKQRNIKYNKSFSKIHLTFNKIKNFLTEYF